MTDENRLVQSCLQQRPFAWQQFVDAFLPVVLQTIQEIAVQTSQQWPESQHEQFSRQVFRQLRDDDFQLLRDWDSELDFTTYLVIATRRIVLNKSE